MNLVATPSSSWALAAIQTRESPYRRRGGPSAGSNSDPGCPGTPSRSTFRAAGPERSRTPGKERQTGGATGAMRLALCSEVDLALLDNIPNAEVPAELVLGEALPEGPHR